MLLLGEDLAVVGLVYLVVLNVLDDHRGLFILDDPTDVLDEFFRIVAEHSQLDRTNPFKDGGYGSAGEGSSLGHLPDQVILDSRGADSSLASDNVADNFEQIFQAYSKETIRRIL